MGELINRGLVALSSVVAALAGMMLVINGDPAAGFAALSFSVLEQIYYEIRWGHDG